MSVQGIIGKKVGMTQVYGEDGRAHPVTVIEAGPCVVVQRKAKDKDGYSAVQLGATAPGPPAVAAALGYLHANCGHCHSETGIARPDTDQILRLSVGESTPEATRAYQTTIGKVLSTYRDPEVLYRVVRG